MGTMSDASFKKLNSNQSDSSDDEPPLGKSAVKAQGILGKGIEIVEEEDEKDEKDPEDDEDIYALKKSKIIKENR